MISSFLYSIYMTLFNMLAQSLSFIDNNARKCIYMYLFSTDNIHEILFQNLITQQGAMYAFKDKNIVYEFKDTGILAYGNVEKALSALGVKV